MRAVSVLVVVLCTSSALAAPWEPKGSDARRLLDEGRAAFKAGDFAEAAALFLRADGAESNLNAQWNAAQSYAAAGDWKAAGQLYDQLLADRTLPKDRRTEVERRQFIAARFVTAEYARDAQKWEDAREQYVALLNDPSIGQRDRVTASIKLEELAKARAAAEAAAARQPEPPPDVEPGPSPPVVPPLVMPPPRAPSRWADTTALVLTGAGLVSLGVGVGLALNARSLDDDASRALDQVEVRDLRDRAATRRTLGYVALGVGAAATVAGVVKFVLVPSPRSPTTARLAPVAGGGIVVVGGSF